MSEETPQTTPEASPPAALPVTTTPPVPTGVAAQASVEPLPELSAEWPSKGYTGPQPWQSQHPDLSHARGLLIPGSAGQDVLDLAAFLAYAGYETSISRGEDPLSRFDQSVTAAVGTFRREYGIEEDPAVISASVPEVVGPWTWEALYRIAERGKA